MNLETYLETNNREIEDVVLLFSVGAALDKVSGDTFPMLIGGKIDVDEPMNLMDMDISDESKEWYNSLAFGEKEIVDEVMDELGYQKVFDPYEGISKEELELYNSVPPCSSMTPVGDK